MAFVSWRTALAVAFACGMTAAWAQSPTATYPAKPVRWLVPSAAGGAFDILTRSLAPAMSEATGQTFFVENRAGAAGLLGMEQGAKAPPDGYTILTAGTSQLVFNPFFHAKLPYNPQKDYAPVVLLADLPIALWVHSSVPATSLAELVKFSKANPEKLNYGSSGVGHIFHLATEMLSSRTGLVATHVPFQGVGPAQNEFLAGRLQMMFSTGTPALFGAWKAGRIRPIVGGSDKRLPGFPDVPSYAESAVPGMDVPNWVGLVVPAATPRDIVNRLNRETVKVLATPAVLETYKARSMDAVPTSPEQFRKKVDDEIAVWGPFIRQLNIKLD
jgi:tripartite-type tricarboxylate transporter receptor subunit TctC